MRPLHQGDSAWRARARRPLVVGAPGDQGVRAACRSRVHGPESGVESRESIEESRKLKVESPKSRVQSPKSRSWSRRLGVEEIMPLFPIFVKLEGGRVLFFCHCPG